LFDRLDQPLVEEVEQGHFLSATIDLLLEETRAPGFATRAFTESLMRQCLLLILRSHFGRSGAASPLFAPLRDERLVRAVTRVLVRPGERHTLHTLAAEAGMSRSVFAQRFAAAFGQTPFEFVLRVRLRHAAHLLRATDLPVKMIADTAGFASRSHFSRAFRTAFGRDPSQYRELRALADGITVPLGSREAEDGVEVSARLAKES
jgi:transcriptional regulator GlxA family with amidase domain